MTDETPTEAEVNVVKLDKRLTAQDAADLNEKISGAQGSALEVDASEVSMISTPCVQVLVSAAMTWNRDGGTFSLTNPSDEFRSILETIGISPDTLTPQEAA